MKILNNSQKNEINKRMIRNFSSHLRINENNKVNNKSLIEQFKNLDKDIYEKNLNNNYSFSIPKKIMKSLLTTINKNSPSSLNSLNSVNFIYQIYEKGINIFQNNNNYSKKNTNIENCVFQEPLKTNFNTNINKSMLTGREYNENYENVKIADNLNFYESYLNKDNSIKSIFKKNNSTKNLNSNYISFINKSNFRNKYRLSNEKITKKFLKKKNSSCNQQENEKNSNQPNNIRFKFVKNRYDKLNYPNNFNFGLLPKSIYNKNKKVEKIPQCVRNRNIKGAKTKTKNYLSDKETQLTLKMFTDKYEKEKENFNDILFDECIELRKKKFKLESFIKKFTNKHFVEKLYRAREFSLKKNANK